MASSPIWKVYGPHGAYQAACKEVEAAAALVSFYGPGATIRCGHGKAAVVWTEEVDGLAADSFDAVAERAHAKSRAAAEARRSGLSAREPHCKPGEEIGGAS